MWKVVKNRAVNIAWVNLIMEFVAGNILSINRKVGLTSVCLSFSLIIDFVFFILI